MMRSISIAFLLFATAVGHSLLADDTNRAPRQFKFATDTLAYANELACDYQVDPVTGKMVSRRRHPKPAYVLHCFVVARTALQFFEHARFEPNEPKASQASYRYLIKLIAARSVRSSPGAGERLVIPGYADLRSFSRDEEALLKSETGGAWQSYLQRGNWRMVFPFSRAHQEKTSRQLTHALEHGQPTIVHLVCFPAETINHALLLFDFREVGREIEFKAYDPNRPEIPVTLSFDRDRKRFVFPPNFYFAGGRVDVYQIYHGPLY
jgi:hypothetical protein